jgi:hypothetical protein
VARSEEDWIDEGMEVIVEILDDQRAATIRELEARAGQRAWNLHRPIQPHILTAARRELLRQDEIYPIDAPAPGLSGVVTTYHLKTLARTYANRAAQRKRLLTARHRGWTESRSRWVRGLAGPAGEAAVHQVLQETDGFTNISPEARTVLGVELSGPVDFAAFLTLADPAGAPWTCTALIEVKNVRQWMYPTDPEVVYFLARAARLQVERPELPVLPILVCRIRHDWTRRLGQAFGFFSVRFFNQWLKPDSAVTQTAVNAVSTELGYDDLRLGSYPNNALRKAMGESLHTYGRQTATRWQQNSLVIDRVG